MPNYGKREHKWENRTVVLTVLGVINTVLWFMYDWDWLELSVVCLLAVIFIVHTIARYNHLLERWTSRWRK